MSEDRGSGTLLIRMVHFPGGHSPHPSEESFLFCLPFFIVNWEKATGAVDGWVFFRS